MAFHAFGQSSQVTIPSQASQPRPLDSGFVVELNPPSTPASSQSQQSQRQPTQQRSSQPSQGSQTSQRSESSQNRRQNKSPFERYKESLPLACGDANGSRMVSSRRHIVEKGIHAPD